MKVLIVDDDIDICNILKISIEYEGFIPLIAHDGKTCMEIINRESDEIALVVLDIMLPDSNGIDLLKEIKKSFTFPVIMLTAKGERADRIMGLRNGANDYINKPFDIEEVRARVSSHCSQHLLSSRSIPNKVVSGNTYIDFDEMVVKVDGHMLEVTSGEYNILAFLLKNQGKVFTKRQIYENITNEIGDNSENTVAVQICNLRKKIRNIDSNFESIETIYGVGYRWKNK